MNQFDFGFNAGANALRWGKFIYILIPKNGSMTFSKLLFNAGWEWVNLDEPDFDISEYYLWGHLTEPSKRHTKGVEQYLSINPDIDINHPQIAKMLVSFAFDEHTYSVHMRLQSIIFKYPIHWIPLDATITDWRTHDRTQLDGNAMTNAFFIEHGIPLSVSTKDIDNKTPPQRVLIQKQIDFLKSQYPDNYAKVTRNILDADIILYNKVLKRWRMKYGSQE